MSFFYQCLVVFNIVICNFFVIGINKIIILVYSIVFVKRVVIYLSKQTYVLSLNEFTIVMDYRYIYLNICSLTFSEIPYHNVVLSMQIYLVIQTKYAFFYFVY